jgi:hypothetical protein
MGQTLKSGRQSGGPLCSQQRISLDEAVRSEKCLPTGDITEEMKRIENDVTVSGAY